MLYCCYLVLHRRTFHRVFGETWRDTTPNHREHIYTQSSQDCVVWRQPHFSLWRPFPYFYPLDQYGYVFIKSACTTNFATPDPSSYGLQRFCLLRWLSNKSDITHYVVGGGMLVALLSYGSRAPLSLTWGCAGNSWLHSSQWPDLLGRGNRDHEHSQL